MGDLRRKPGVFDATGRSSTNLAWPGYLKHYFSGSSVYLSLFKRGSLPKIFYIYFFFLFITLIISLFLFFFSLSPCFKFNLPTSHYSSFSPTGTDMQQR